MRHFLALGSMLLLFISVRAEKVLIYDEEKGIIFIEKGDIGKKPAKTAEPILPAPAPVIPKKATPVHHQTYQPKPKDPPELYFKSGLEYFKESDFANALRNFMYADSVDPKPEYALWVGKTQRQLGRPDKMLLIMQQILKTFPESEIADDALFEIAFYHQTQNDYDTAIALYTQLAEQYPFGKSYSNGELFRDIAQEQRKAMRAEMVSTLALLGFQDDDLDNLYTAFQKKYKLPQTGKGDRTTVTTIKAKHQEFLANESKQADQAQNARRATRFVIILTVILSINLLLLAGQFAMLRSRRRQIISLQQLLSDLNTKAL